MTNYEVTLKQLRDAGACVDGYNKVVCMLNGVKYEPRDTYMRFSHKEPIGLVDIANNNGVGDAIWCLKITNDDRDNRLFAVLCARQVQHLMEDDRSINALDVAERFANGEASQGELSAARAAALEAAGAAAGAAALEAAGAAAWAAAWAAAREPAWEAARAAAWAAAGAAAWAAAWAAARAAAGSAARAAARAAQKEMFIKMCNGEAPWQVKS